MPRLMSWSARGLTRHHRSVPYWRLVSRRRRRLLAIPLQPGEEKAGEQHSPITQVAGGVLFPLMITYSQVISPERRGVLAGAVTSSFFFAAALIPSLFEPLFLLGMPSLYLGILGVSVLLLIFISILYRRIEPPEYH